MHRKILFVDDELEMRDLVKEGLAGWQFDVEACGSVEEALGHLEGAPVDAIVVDVNLEGATSGLELCRRVNTSHPEVPVIVVTGFGSMEMAVGAIRAGAYDFITKPIDMDQLLLVLGRAIQLRELEAEVKRLREQVASPRALGEMIGRSPPIEELFDLVERVADSEATVLVTGESGTGKELVARALHERSRRSGGPFIAINCAALPETILESELFGHVRGAFTDASARTAGLLVAASGGTLFLDEIGEMSVSTQAKLLRVLQERSVRPVGGNQEVPFDVRIVTATNRDLEADVANHRFREDLYYRVNVVRIQVPPLRARGNDILLLAQAFIVRFAQRSGKAVHGISGSAAERLLSYDWPGNVRELQNCIERGVALTRFESLNVEDLPAKIREYRTTELVFPTENPAELLSLDEVDRRYLLRVLHALNGNRTLTARVLGLDRRTLYRRLRRYGQIPPEAAIPAEWAS